jgi:uncharacterized protein (DUF2249 family)
MATIGNACCLLMDRDKISNLHRGPAIDASHQASVHLAKQFQRRRIKKFSQSETRIACGKHLWKVLCKNCSFHPDPLTNMAATGHSCF